MNIKFNVENVSGILQALYTLQVEKEFGILGSQKLKVLLNEINMLYRHIPAERITGSLTIKIKVAISDDEDIINDFKETSIQRSYFDLAEKIKCNTSSHIIVEILENCEFVTFICQNECDCAELAKNSIIYKFINSTDYIYAKKYQCQIPKLSPVLASNFCIPTLNGLEDALALYNSRVAKYSSCPTLSGVWEGGVEGPRLVLVNKPESIMRDSLTNALRLLLAPDAEVRPEHNTDETKPVDIKISWIGSRASALIEIKWLGRSLAKPRGGNIGKMTFTNYALPRVQEGALQLADYLDREVRSTNATAHKGYLVIFDARRKNIQGPDDKLQCNDAFHFENDEINLDVDYPNIRDDYSKPYRFFMAPKKSLTT
ncbi:hypothetical protein V5K00_RS17900 [Enterobacter asburiae]